MMSSPEAGHFGRGGGAQYLSGFQPDREARSQPGVTVAGGTRGPIVYDTHDHSTTVPQGD